MNNKTQPISQQDLSFDREHIWHPYTSMSDPLETYPVVSSQGCELTLSDGTVLVDGTSSWWACIHGYGHPAILTAMEQQLKKLSHVMFGGITHQAAIDASKLLLELTSPKLTKVFLADSGSISVEVAIKMALQYWQGRANTLAEDHNKHCGSKQRIMTVKSGYHGDTFAAMSVCDPDGGMHTMFGANVTRQLFMPAPLSPFDGPLLPEDEQALDAAFIAHHQDVAAVIIEPIMQGAGGMRFYSPAYLSKLRQLCDRYEVLLILDEIATGFGRTGKLFAYEHANIEADILCLGKALTGGYISLAATLCSDEVAQGIGNSPAGVFMHGPTFMGNPLACAAATASLSLIKQGSWQAQVAAIEAQLKQELSDAIDIEQVRNVRVLGAVGVIEMKQRVNTAKLQQAFIAQGVWVRPFSNLIYIMPPYTISPAQLTQLTQAMKQVAASIEADTGHSTNLNKSHGNNQSSNSEPSFVSHG